MARQDGSSREPPKGIVIRIAIITLIVGVLTMFATYLGLLQVEEVRDFIGLSPKPSDTDSAFTPVDGATSGATTQGSRGPGEYNSPQLNSAEQNDQPTATDLLPAAPRLGEESGSGNWQDLIKNELEYPGSTPISEAAARRATRSDDSLDSLADSSGLRGLDSAGVKNLEKYIKWEAE